MPMGSQLAAPRMPILAISDLHTDFRENRMWLEHMPGEPFKDAILIVAGDISDRLDILASTLALLRTKFLHVFYVPGNHELWVRREAGTSIDKFFRILDLCEALDIRTRPAQIGGVWIVPLFSWYEANFDADPRGAVTGLNGWTDFHLCRWPGGMGHAADFFLRLNEPHLRAYEGPIISFSHFLPRRDLLPPTDRLKFKGLPKVAGCAALDAQIRQLGSRVHVFGHSHISCDRVINGVRYVQNPLRYPRERLFSGCPVKIIMHSDGEASDIAPCR
jgi:predicted phosphodiesterase